ncbi:MAG: DUF58 domain-containing protein [Candidatus Rifleibacteriota bacterium]
MKDTDLKAVEAAEQAAHRFYLNVSSRFSGMSGGNRFGRNTGNSLEYLDHREYQPGDDIRHIDWNAMARSDKLTVKLFREEVTPHLDILIDASVSMNLENTGKSAALYAMAALLRMAAYNAGYSVSSWLIKDRYRLVEPASLPVSRWPDAELDFRGNTGQTIVSFPVRLKSQGVRIFLSDLFWDHEPMSVLQQLSDRAALLTVVQILAKSDVDPSLAGNVRLVDTESNEAIELMANSALIDTYRQNFNRHQEYWKRCCIKTGAVFTHCIAEDFTTDFVPVDLLQNELIMTRS